MSETFPAITIWQPWATLIAEGLKPFEFRGWSAPSRLIGRRVAIHAGARPMRRIEVADLVNRLGQPLWRDTGLIDRARALDFFEAMWRAWPSRGPNPYLPLSHVVCTAVLGQPIRNEELAEKMGIAWANDSDRDEHSNWGWPLTEVRRLEPPVPARGAQGFWRVTLDE